MRRCVQLKPNCSSVSPLATGQHSGEYSSLQADPSGFTLRAPGSFFLLIAGSSQLSVLTVLPSRSALVSHLVSTRGPLCPRCLVPPRAVIPLPRHHHRAAAPRTRTFWCRPAARCKTCVSLDCVFVDVKLKWSTDPR